MTSKTRPSIDYEHCVAYYRAGRRIAGAAAIERYLSANPRTAERAARDAAHDLALARRYDPVLNEPVPPRLLRGHDTSPWAWMTGVGLVAMIGLSAAGGWWLRGLESGVASPVAATSPRTFGQQVARLTDHRPEIDAAARVTTHRRHPDLSQAGYRFTERRVVPTAGGPSFTAYDYRNTAGQQVTIYARAEPGAEHATPNVISPSGVSLARWQAHGYEYALTGDLPSATLNELAEIAARAPDEGEAGPRAPAAPTVKVPQQPQAPTAVGQSVERPTAAQQQPASGL